MRRRLLAFLTIPALAALAAAAPPPARAQGIFGRQPAAVHAVMNELRGLCRAHHMRAFFVADFLFGVDADRDGRDDDIYLTAAGFSCVRPGREPDSGNQGHNLCNASGCMQWLIVQNRGRARLVWRGRTPSLFAAGQEGLVDTTSGCSGEDCPRYLWNGRALVRLRRGHR